MEAVAESKAESPIVRGAVLRLPALHEKQEIFGWWNDDNPNAQVLVAPCGTKSGKSFGSASWLVKEAWSYPGLFCVWIAPTYLKARIGYRYIKAMLPQCEFVNCIDGRMEIYLGNGSFIKFLHGQDAEITVEGEGIDRFVIDEAGKTSSQLWYSLLTTITKTRGLGIVTGTPRGFTWYYDVFRKAKNLDPFFVWAQFSTEDSPFISQDAIDKAHRLLPKPLFDQYYRAAFVSMSTCFGDLSGIWREDLKVERQGFWIHPDKAKRAIDSCTGADVAKVKDWTVFSTVNAEGETIGFYRFRGVSYKQQAQRLKKYLEFFDGDLSVRYDSNGVGVAFGEALEDLDIDASISGVAFTNASKSEMVARTTLAIENKWWSCPRIEAVEHEFSSFEVSVTKSGLHSYAAPEGEHDDVVCSFLLSISGAYSANMADELEKMFAEEERKGAEAEDTSEFEAYTKEVTEDSDEEDDFDLDEEDFTDEMMDED